MPTTFTSKRYRSLLLKTKGERVQFQNGSAEVPDRLVESVDEFAKAHPDFEIERGESTEAEKPRLTAKQQAIADAEALGLDTSGKTADILARIEAHKAAESSEDGDDSDSEESDDQSDDSDEDEAGEADSSEDDEN